MIKIKSEMIKIGDSIIAGITEEKHPGKKDRPEINRGSHKPSHISNHALNYKSFDNSWNK